jgi:hypothetical protein
MANFLLAYKAGAGPGTPEEGQAAMAAWMAWFGSMGTAVVDIGNPFGPSKTVSLEGVSDGGDSELSGYSIVSAAGIDAAVALAKGCPIVAGGGSVEVYQIHPAT